MKTLPIPAKTLINSLHHPSVLSRGVKTLRLTYFPEGQRSQSTLTNSIDSIEGLTLTVERRYIDCHAARLREDLVLVGAFEDKGSDWDPNTELPFDVVWVFAAGPDGTWYEADLAAFWADYEPHLALIALTDV